MPLIIVTGLPCSGKSTTAKELQVYLEKRLPEERDSRHVRIVSDSDTLDWDGRDEIFSSISKEKQLRGWLKAEAQRYVNLNQIVILDASAYIKGFRYELYCMSKEAKTHYCVIEKLIDQETCWNWNQARLGIYESDPDKDPEAPIPAYKRETFEALILRYEKCDEENRWDSPLFRINNQDDSLDLGKIYDSITKENPLASNKCTITSTTTSTIFKPSKT